jgi:hypothetical protein
MIMEYAIGLGLALSLCALGTFAGLDRDRALYPVMLIVIASYYDLFAVLGGDTAVLAIETAAFIGFVSVSLIGFRTNLWIVVLALTGHGVFDFFHDQVTVNAGAPAWWPMFCASFDVAAGVYLAWMLFSKRIDAQDRSRFASRIRPHVDAELAAAKAAERAGDHLGAFHHLERAHVLGQRSTVRHVAIHVRMLMWGLRHGKPREVLGQVVRVIGAGAKTWIGLVPHGNTGGADVSAFKSMAIPDDLAGLIAAARSASQMRA